MHTIDELLQFNFAIADIAQQFGGNTEADRQKNALTWAASWGLIRNQVFCIDETCATEEGNREATFIKQSRKTDTFS